METLMAKGDTYCQGFNFGPSKESVLNVSEVVEKIINYWGQGEFTINKKDNLHEANLLMLDVQKAKDLLNWEPTYSAEDAIAKTIEWYKQFYENNDNMLEFTIGQIKEFESIVKTRIDDKWKSCCVD
jgi:CDP-glucose 4,6-dehydratase